MKLISALILALFFYTTCIFSQEEAASIYFYRPLSYKGAAMAIKVSVDGKYIGKLQLGERLLYKTSDFNTRKLYFEMVNLNKEIMVDLKPGSETYILLELGFMDLDCRLMEISAGRNEFNNQKKFKRNTEPFLVSESILPTDHLTDNAVISIPSESPSLPQVQAKEKPVVKEVSETYTGKRLALIIGNSSYQHAGYLRNPTNDAEDIARTLKELGFEVMLFTNQDMKSMKQAIDAFGLKLNNYDVGLFYYAGHGVQSKGFNYFIPVDANLQTEAQVEFDCVRTDRLLSLMEDANNTTNIIILDACRDNPFERSWRRSATGSGLAFMDAPSGSLIAYATAPGRTASDGHGRNGLYTSALLKYLKEPGIGIEEMFKKVREEVSNQSDKQQIPWESTSLVGAFYFSVK